MGGGKCFSCGYVNSKNAAGHDETTEVRPLPAGHGLLAPVEFAPLAHRGLSEDICKRYGYGWAERGDARVQVAPYYDQSGRLVAQKVRTKTKGFYVLGSLSHAGLFGQKCWKSGGKRIVITEGEIDALSVCQALGGTWPAVSVPTGAGGAPKAILAQLEYLESFDTVCLAFDADEAGQEATEACVELFSPGKVAIVDLAGYKDPNDALVQGGARLLRDAVWQAKDWRPDGVICLADIRDRITAPLEMGTSYPWASLNEKLYGFRPTDLVTWCAGSGVGKTAIVSELVYHLIAREDMPTGIVYLEETVVHAGRRIVGLALNLPLHLPNTVVSDEDFAKAWDNTLGRRNLFAYEHFGSLNTEILLNRIRYMVRACGVRVVILDHVSMVVSGGDLDGDERRLLDFVMTKLKSLAIETGAAIHVVAHLSRPSGATKSHEEGRKVSLRDLRGTQGIAQLSDAVIAAERDTQADNIEERNTTSLRVLKNRYTGLTGPAGKLRYNPETARLYDIWDEIGQQNAPSDF